METQGTIKTLIEKIKKNEKLEVYLFYHEIPIKQVLDINDVEESKKQIEFKINGKIEAAVNESKELYIRFNKDILVLRPIIWNREFLITSFPSYAIEPKLNRNYPRVKCSTKNPIILEDKSIGVCLHIKDISEGGIGFKIPENLEIRENNIHDVELNISGKPYPTKIRILYRVKTDDKLYKVGAAFVDISVRLSDAIAKYVMNRQMEIARVLNTFAD